MSGKICRIQIRAQLALLWMRFLRHNFVSPREVQDVFGCGQSTAYRWWCGQERPSSDALIAAYQARPGAFEKVFSK